MEEITCSVCGCHVGWITDNAPKGFIYCDDCKKQDEDEEEEESEI